MIILIQMVLFCLLFTAMVMYAVRGGANDDIRIVDTWLRIPESMLKK